MNIPETTFHALIPKAIELRHTLHKNPEIALGEHATRERLKSFLGNRLIEKPPLLGTDLIVEIPGIDTSRCIAFRADMDALPLSETSGKIWTSANTGLAHSCGHDGHMAILATTARILAESEERPPVSLRFVFQPGEEVVAAGRDLAAAGAYQGVSAAYALHGWPGLPLGSVSVRDGIAFAASHHFNATFIGKGGHGAYPEKSINPLRPAAQSFLDISNLHQEISRTYGEVVSCGYLEGGSGTNVIPEKAGLGGNVRFFSTERGIILESFIREILEKNAAICGTELVLDYDTRYNQPLINNTANCRIVREVAAEVSIPCLNAEKPEMASEDFAFALQKVPGCLFKLGLGEQQPGLHSPDFDFPDDALSTGITMMLALAMRGLGNFET